MTGEPIAVIGIGHEGPSGLSPAALAHIAQARVLAGGKRHLAAVVQRLKPGGRIVMNCITLENFSLAWNLLRRHNLQVDTTAVQLSYAKPLGKWHRLEADNPIFLLRATTP